MIIAAAILFVLVGIAMIIARDYLARMESMFAGGSIVPGCVIAEAVVFFLLAALAIGAWRLGLIAS